MSQVLTCLLSGILSFALDPSLLLDMEFRHPPNMPLPHRLFGLAPQSGKWNQKTPAELSKGSSDYKKGWFLAFRSDRKGHSVLILFLLRLSTTILLLLIHPLPKAHLHTQTKSANMLGEAHTLVCRSLTTLNFEQPRIILIHLDSYATVYLVLYIMVCSLMAVKLRLSN